MKAILCDGVGEVKKCDKWQNHRDHTRVRESKAKLLYIEYTCSYNPRVLREWDLRGCSQLRRAAHVAHAERLPRCRRAFLAACRT